MCTLVSMCSYTVSIYTDVDRIILNVLVTRASVTRCTRAFMPGFAQEITSVVPSIDWKFEVWQTELVNSIQYSALYSTVPFRVSSLYSSVLYTLHNGTNWQLVDKSLEVRSRTPTKMMIYYSDGQSQICDLGVLKSLCQCCTSASLSSNGSISIS